MVKSKDIAKEVDTIFNSLTDDLLKAGAINKEYKILKPQMFLDVVEHTEDELIALLPEVESEAGVVIDRNGANIIQSTLATLDQMKQKMTMTPFSDHHTAIDVATTPSKPSKFAVGIKKMFGKFTSKRTPKTIRER